MTENSGKVAVVTGGASGIGKALCEELAGKGYRVAVVDISHSEAQAIARQLGKTATAWQCDVADSTRTAALATDIWHHYHGVDMVFSNAGVGAGNPLLKATPEEFDFIFGINVRGMWLVCQAFAKLMIEHQRQGKLCVTGSEHSLGFQHAGAGLYTASKHAILGIADVLRTELPEGISISVFCPGLVNTRFYDSKRHSNLNTEADGGNPVAKAMMNKGMPAREVAEAAVKGVERGEFLIVTHGCSYTAAAKRWRDIDSAFAAQAPYTPESDRYLVNNVMKQVLQEMKSS